MVANEEKGSAVWWDREVDANGNSIRDDVRKAAQEVWESACALTDFILGDTSEAPDVMEGCVDRVSRSLNARKHPINSQKTAAMLMVSFRRELYARAARLRRIELIGDALEVAEEVRQPASWDSEIDFRLDLEKVARCLSKRSRTILVLRDAGYDWKEIARMLQVSVSVAKNTFWRELQQVKEYIQGQQKQRKKQSKGGA